MNRIYVGVHRPGEAPRNLSTHATLREGEKAIEEIEKTDPAGVHAGYYYIDAPEEEVNP